MPNYFNYTRRRTHEVNIGATPLGGDNPIRIQSMTNTPTTDTEACVAQAKRIIAAGGDYVRLTTQGTREAENLRNINAALRAEGINTPLVADVHFNPNVADVAALYAEKVRINPGNYVDAARTFKKIEYTDEEYAAELKKIEQRFVPFLDICRAHHTAIRIGVNHGSLSDRIMSRYGDTPAGIVESCMEFLRICVKEHFTDVVVSIKASNTVIMVQSVRLLVNVMKNEKMDFPIHLGVTEAGNGEDGRIKSALGIGTLLADGIGDTIRVSLAEPPENEIPVARKLVDHILKRQSAPIFEGHPYNGMNRIYPVHRPVHPVSNIGYPNQPVVLATYVPEASSENAPEASKDIAAAGTALHPDYLYCGHTLPPDAVRTQTPCLVDFDVWQDLPNLYPRLPHIQTPSDTDLCSSQNQIPFPPLPTGERRGPCLSASLSRDGRHCAVQQH